MKCFYHSADLDGHCSGALIKRFYDLCELIPINYGDKFPWETIGEQEMVFMVDFSLQPFEEMLRLADRANLIWIDHHETAIQDYRMTGWSIEGVRENGKAACELVWEYLFSGEEMPDAVRLLGRYDVLDLDYSNDVMPFQYGMRRYDTDPRRALALWTDLLCGDLVLVERIIQEGQSILSHETASNAKYAGAFAFETEFEGLSAIAMNRGQLGSLAFESVFDPDKHDIMIGFVRRMGQWTVTLYSRDGINVGEIAKKYGGGGHANAAGFQCEKLPFAI